MSHDHRKRGLQQRYMIVFMQVAITSGNERNATEMRGRAHGGDPVKTRGDSFFHCRQSQILTWYKPTDLLERVGAGMSFRPLRAASAMASYGWFSRLVESSYTRSLLEEQIFGLQFDGVGITLFGR